MVKRYLFLFCCFVFFNGCSVQAMGNTKQKGEETVSIVNWNLQTFFDAETCGTEYSDFTKSSKWSRDKYVIRLQRLSEVITTLNADIYVFEEIENEGILYDISNQLAMESWKKDKWSYGCFAKTEGSAIGCGILSKYPILKMTSHTMDIRCQKNAEPFVRPIVEVLINVNGKELVLLANHWKSKADGEAKSEIWRDWQETVLFSRLEKLSGTENCVICGDFNRNCTEFVTDFSFTGKNTVIRGNETKTGKEKLYVYSPWFNADGKIISKIGSYYYKGNWEYIDNIFSFGKAEITSFTPRFDEPWATNERLPYGYNILSGEGYSDHLPLMAKVKLY